MNEFAVEMKNVVQKFTTPEGGDLIAGDHATIQIRNGERVWISLAPANTLVLPNN